MDNQLLRNAGAAEPDGKAADTEANRGIGFPRIYDLLLRISYTFERSDSKPVALRAQVINVGNNNYWITAGRYLAQNQPRT